jgi:uncharacterized protein YjbJ (UPF0337 family)
MAEAHVGRQGNAGQGVKVCGCRRGCTWEPFFVGGICPAGWWSCHAFATKEISMDWNWVEGNWKEIKGKARQAWGKLTDDELDKIAGKREELEGMIQKRYGVSKDLAQKDVEDWLKKVR